MFRFLEDVSAPVNWPRIQATNVTQIERMNDVESVTSFLADCAVGDADDGYIEYESRAQKISLKHLQLSIQYLLHSREALRHRQRTLDTGLRRLSKREENEKKRVARRATQIKILKDELQRQEDALSTYRTILRARDPDLASRVARDRQEPFVLDDKNGNNNNDNALTATEDVEESTTTTSSRSSSDESSFSSLSSDESNHSLSAASDDDDDDDPAGEEKVVLLLNPHRPPKQQRW